MTIYYHTVHIKGVSMFEYKTVSLREPMIVLDGVDVKHSLSG